MNEGALYTVGENKDEDDEGHTQQKDIVIAWFHVASQVTCIDDFLKGRREYKRLRQGKIQRGRRRRRRNSIKGCVQKYIREKGKIKTRRRCSCTLYGDKIDST